MIEKDIVFVNMESVRGLKEGWVLEVLIWWWCYYMCVKFDDFIEVFKKIKWYDIVVEINKVLNLLRLMEDEE